MDDHIPKSRLFSIDRASRARFGAGEAFRV
jgi:hypothetical protein